jgi:hypothetical protein
VTPPSWRIAPLRSKTSASMKPWSGLMPVAQTTEPISPEVSESDSSG